MSSQFVQEKKFCCEIWAAVLAHGRVGNSLLNQNSECRAKGESLSRGPTGSTFTHLLIRRDLRLTLLQSIDNLLKIGVFRFKLNSKLYIICPKV